MSAAGWRGRAQSLAVCVVAFVASTCEPGETVLAEFGVLTGHFDSENVQTYTFSVRVDGPSAKTIFGSARVRVDSVSVPSGESVLASMYCGEQDELVGEETLPRDPPQEPVGVTNVRVAIPHVPVEHTCTVEFEYTGAPEPGVSIDWELYVSVKTDIPGACGRDLVDVTIELLDEED